MKKSHIYISILLYVISFFLLVMVPSAHSQASGGSTGGSTTLKVGTATCSSAGCNTTATCPTPTSTIIMSLCAGRSIGAIYSDANTFFSNLTYNTINVQNSSGGASNANCVGQSSCTCGTSESFTGIFILCIN